MGVIPDPTNPTGPAINGETGNLMGAVFFAPAGADPSDPDIWKHVGWSEGIDAGGAE